MYCGSFLWPGAPGEVVGLLVCESSNRLRARVALCAGRVEDWSGLPSIERSTKDIERERNEGQMRVAFDWTHCGSVAWKNVDLFKRGCRYFAGFWNPLDFGPRAPMFLDLVR
jgi:hypothetical protein